jgi:hypothetical protein
MQLMENPLSKLAILIIVTSAVAFYGNIYINSGSSDSAVVSNQEFSEEETKESLIRKLELEVINLNNGLPKRIDDDTRADSISVEPGPRLVTKYTYTSFSTAEFDIDKFNKKVKKNIKNGICENDEVLKRMQLGLIYRYEFYGNDGIELVTAEFGISDCL